MKVRSKATWSQKDDWETPRYVLDWIEQNIFKWQPYSDPCPLWHDIELWDWLEIDRDDRNYCNPPYNITDKPKFVKKAYEEYLKWNLSVLLIPSTTETKWFHEYLAPYAGIYFIKGRVKFKWYNTKWEYVTNKTGQSGSMLCVLDPKWDPFMTTLEF